VLIHIGALVNGTVTKQYVSKQTVYAEIAKTKQKFLLFFGVQVPTVPCTGIGRCLGTEGNRVSQREGGEGGLGPPDKKRDKQSSPSKEGDNMEQEEEGKKSQA
jgi:hypothetical protein